MRIYTENIPVKFHPDPIWNDGALGILNTVSPTRKKQEQEQDQ